MQAAVSAGSPVSFGKQWQGQTADGRFPLQQYLGGDDDHAAFLTLRDSNKAVIKLVLAASPDPELQLASWRRATQLSHPNLLRTFECGRCWLAGKELLFVVSEYGEENLAEILQQRALSQDEVEAALKPILEALSYLHRQGLAHRRVRPSNIMAIGDRLKISTDGVQAAGPSAKQPRQSVYDAPEIALGELSPAADVWSLGATLVEALKQHPPSKTASGADLNLPQPFEDIVRHCLREDPSSRWTLSDISARLTQAAKTGAVATLSTAGTDAHQKRSPLRWIAVAAVAVLVAAGVVFLRRSTNSSQPAAGPAEVSSPVNAGQPNVTPSNSPGAVAHRVVPAPSESALRTVHGHIKVRVRASVSASGDVTNAKFLTAGPSKYFSRLAMQAAQQWKFAAPMANGRPVASEWTLLFEFSRGGTQASAEPSEPR